MRFEIPFNEKISIEQSKLFFTYLYKKFIKDNFKIFFYGVFIVLIGVFMVYWGNNSGLLLVGFGSMYFVIVFNRIATYLKTKKTYFLSRENYFQKIKNLTNPINVWQFDEDHLFFSDLDFEIKLNWNTFKSYKKIDEKNLLLEINNPLILFLILSKEEVDDKNFDKIIHFLEGKIKNK